VPPPTPATTRTVGWFLDYFSSGELKRYLERGASQPVRDVLTVAAMSIGVTIISVIYVLGRLSSLRTDPGAMIFVDCRAGGLPSRFSSFTPDCALDPRAALAAARCRRRCPRSSRAKSSKR